jgi:hypothetical protein
MLGQPPSAVQRSKASRLHPTHVPRTRNAFWDRPRTLLDTCATLTNFALN